MGLSNWPTIVDDDGSLTLGTVLEKAVFDAIKASIEADVFSTTNPAVTAENIIDEVVTARGSKASLDARLDIALNEDGTLKTQASLVTQADASSITGRNMVINDNFLIWAAGDAVAPTKWIMSGTGAACERSGTGLGDTETKIGDFSAKLTYGSTTLLLYQLVLGVAEYAKLAPLKGTTFGFGAWVKSSVASQARLFFSDGVTSTYSSYHTGDGTWQWLSGTHTQSNTGTYALLGLSVESSAGNPVYLSGAMAAQQNIAPAAYRPTAVAYGTVHFPNPGIQTAGTDKAYFYFNRPTLIKDIGCSLTTAPTGATTFKVDVNKDGTTMLGSVIAFTASDKIAGKAPDGTYAQRCFDGARLTSGVTIGNKISFDIDDVGNTIPGSDLNVNIRAMVYVHPFESFLEP